MGADTKIEWAHHTFNPWTGCTRVSPGCDNCYAEALSKRSPATFGAWTPGAPRKRTSPAYWDQPRRWNARAERAGTPARVFCASVADVFDNQAPPEWRADLWALIWETPWLNWLLLTKRPQNIRAMLPGGWGRDGWQHVWLGTTVENQEEADRRIPHLLAVPARVRFLSCEPLLGPIDLTRISGPNSTQLINALLGTSRDPDWTSDAARIDWVIAGGESGPGARPMAPAYARALRNQCEGASVPFFFKQWGEWQPLPSPAGGTHHLPGGMMKRTGKKAAGRLLDDAIHEGVPDA